MTRDVRAMYENLEVLEIPDERGLGSGRINGSQSEWKKLLRRYCSIEAVAAIPAAECQRDCAGRRISAGFFAVPKEMETLRPICNRCSKNKTERSVGAAAALMAYGSALVDADLEDDEDLEISTDDLPDYYTTLRTSAKRTEAVQSDRTSREQKSRSVCRTRSRH